MGRRPGRGARADERGSAVVDFALIMLVLVPLFLGIAQVALVMYVRTTLTSAASEGARLAATVDRGPGDGAARTRSLIDSSLGGRYAKDVSAGTTVVDGAPMVVVRVRAEVPPLGMFGPGIALTAEGHAVEEPTS